MKGEIVHLTIFDVGAELDLSRIGSVLGQEPRSAPLVARSPTPRYAAFPAPLEVLPHGKLLGASDGTSVEIRLHSMGAVAVRFRVPIEFDRLEELPRLAAALRIDRRTPSEAARWLLDQMRPDLEDARLEPYDIQVEPETYVIHCLWEAGIVADRLLREDPMVLAVVLEGEVGGTRLAKEAVDSALRHRVRYYETDAVIVGWENALIFAETGAYEDLLDVMELANLELLEFRTYDAYLDRSLDQAFELLRRLWAPGGLFRSARGVLADISELRVEFARLTDNLRDTGKIFGDWYVAKVHRKLRDRFHLADWQATVEDKMETLEDMFQLAGEETVHRRGLLLETMIVLLFIIDLVLIYLLSV